jgi:methionine-rich copper-binding protein CopC/putative copper export protein
MACPPPEPTGAWANCAARHPSGVRSGVRLASRRAGTALALFAAVVLWLMVLPAATASAHADLIGSEPAAGSVETTTPGVVLLVFSSSLRPGSASIEVRDRSGSLVSQGEVEVDDAAASARLAPDAGAGTFLVTWAVSAVDGHDTTGSFSFSVSPSGPPVSATPLPGTPADGGNLDGTAPGTPVAPSITSAVAGGTAQVSSARTVLRAGSALAIGLLGTVAVLWRLRGIRPGRRFVVQALTATAVMAASVWTASNTHAPEVGQALAGTLLMVIHVAAMTTWAASVLALAVISMIRPRMQRTSVWADQERFGRWAVVAVPLGLAAGVLAAINELGGWRLIITGDAPFPRLILLKIGLAAVALALAAGYRWRADRHPPGHRGRLVLLGAESLVLVVALGASGVLTQHDPKADLAATTRALTMGARVAVATCPDTDRSPRCSVQLFTRAGTPDISVSRLTAQLSQGTRVTPRLDIGKSTGSFSVEPGELPMGGTWLVRLSYRNSAADEGDTSFVLDIHQ